MKFGRVAIRKGSYIDARSTIIPGAETRKDSIIGAGSLETNDLPPCSVAYLVPARVVGLTDELREKFLFAISDRTQDGNKFYLDILPWRERRLKMNSKEVLNLYERFLRNID